MKNKRIVFGLITIVIIFIITFLLILLFDFSYDTYGKLYINEVMASNSSTIKDKYGDYSDYIEIYNGYDYDIDLSNYYLSDTYTNAKKWSFPKIMIEKGSYLLIFATGKNTIIEGEIHTNFKLSKSGETVTLTNNKEKRLSSVHYLNTKNDTSYGYNGSDYVYYYSGTPGKINIGDYSEIPIDDDVKLEYSSDVKNIENEIIINEVDLENEIIEIKNTTSRDISLVDYVIADKNGRKAKLPDIIIKPDGYYVVYGSDNYIYTGSKLYTGFHLNNHSEKLYLYKNDKLINEFKIGKLTSKVSVGINSNGERVYYKEKTLGSENSDNYYLGYSKNPTFNINGGYIDAGTKVEFDVPDGTIVYYTLNGSFPNLNSIKYTGPIEINNTITIKAIAFKEGYLESDVISRTFIVGRKHDLPVVSISTNGDELFGSVGILTNGVNASNSYPYYGANFWSDKEVKATFELYEEGKLGISFTCGIKVFGGWSRGEAQKSMSVNLRKEYGQSEFTYPLFKDNNTFKKIVLRNGGQDFGKLKLKDAFLQNVLEGQMDIDKQDYKFVVVYINGNYFGIYNIREKADLSYVERYYDVEEKNVDFIERNNDVKSGNLDDWNNLINYVKNANMKNDETYEYLDTQIDLQELANYWVVETYFDQFDPINIKRYKIKETGKWRWILFDLDQSFYSYTYTTVKFNLPFQPYAHGNGYYLDTTLMSYLIKNPRFRELYLETFSYHLKNTFEPNRMIRILDDMIDEIKTEMPYHIDRWYYESKNVSSYTLRDMNNWYNNLSYFKNQLKERYNITLKTIKDGLNLTDEEYNNYFKDI